MTLTLTFHGAAQTVTGSKHLLEADGARLLVDCGMFQGLKPLRLRNWEAPAFDPRSVAAVVLTHAHLDHSGYLPRLVREGFRGPILATPATIALAEILLMDAASIQEEDAEYANRKGFSKHHPALPLFDTQDVERAVKRFRPLEPGARAAVGPHTIILHGAGHILGSAFAEISSESGGQATTTVFSGDLGRTGVPLHPDPEPLPECDTLVLESTYGDRHHDKTPLQLQLTRAIGPTLRQGGVVLIPAFAVARTQLITLLLARAMASGELPRVPIHVDSPMAARATEVYLHYLGSSELDRDVALREMTRGVSYERTVAESRRLNELDGPRVIISSSGMLTGGRVLHHLRRLAGDARNLIVLPGYQAEGTRGRALSEGARTIRVHGQDIRIVAQTAFLDSFSAHADQEGLVAWAVGGGNPPRTVFLVHGEHGGIEALAARLRSRGMRAQTPGMDSSFTFVPGSKTWRQS